MRATLAQLQQIFIFSGLNLAQFEQLQTQGIITPDLRGEIILHEGDRLPTRLFAVLNGRITVKKTATTGKEAILRTLPLTVRVNERVNNLCSKALGCPP